MTEGKGHDRHAIAPLRRETREKVIYAVDMYGRPTAVGADATHAIANNYGYWSFDPDTDQGICATLKVPIDRVPRTPLTFYFLYSIATGPGGMYVMWRLDHTILGEGDNVTAQPVVRTVRDLTRGVSFEKKSDPIVISASLIDVRSFPVEINLGIIRWAANMGDTETATADLYKVVCEYTAYV